MTIHLSLSQFSTYLKPRKRDMHKGEAGHLLVIGGDEGYLGAVLMAGEAALRVGAGLVTVLTHPSHAPWLSLYRPELMARGVTADMDLSQWLDVADAIVLGPGLGRSAWSAALWEVMARYDKKPVLVDADGLFWLAKKPHLADHRIITPHPGEAARLLFTDRDKIQSDRLSSVMVLQHQYGGVAVLKGAGTLIATPDEKIYQCDAGNPGMATGGMGDVLSGVIGGYLAQGVPLKDAALLGVTLHAMAGDAAAKLGERGMIATDLMAELRLLSNHL